MNSLIGLKLQEWFISIGIPEHYASLIKSAIIILAIILISYLAYLITNKVIFRIISKLVRRTKYAWDDIIFQKKVFKRLSHIVPAIIIYYFALTGLAEFPVTASIIQSAAYIYMIFVGMLVLDAFLSALHSAYLTLPISKEKPIKGYIQSVKIVIYAFGIIFILSVILGKSPGTLLASLGAIAAILILVFKDTILGFVSSIQLSANQMVKPGDWITMPSKDADGTVIEITLNTVKVQNFDKTIVTIPTYSLISESFQNWRGMEESGGRRIARSIYIDLKSIKFCDNEMLDKFKKIKLIRAYVDEKQTEIENHNKHLEVDDTDMASRRNLTNIGVYRKYIEIYLEKHPKIHGIESNYTLIVRHLQPTENGLPIQIYAFSKDQDWGKFEQVQADIFDHIFAVVPEFDLRVFQNPTGYDFMKLTNQI
ncbi:MAG: mechanosensitive ion channel family protein [Bacteroidales bacterium]|nr:mechanosensitive ion channel family protein [Bacteroidales bacterium]